MHDAAPPPTASPEAGAAKNAPKRRTAPLCEAFCSFQGEGPSVGVPTAFVRAAGCPLRCSYCDSTETYEAPAGFRVRDFDGSTLAEFENPASAASVVDAFAESPCFAGLAELSFTGGEPLLWPGFGQELFARAHELGLRTHLETAALDAAALATVLPELDHLGMDWKLPSTVQGQVHADAHRACLETALAHECAVTVKVVVPAREDDEELRSLLELLEALAESCGAFDLVLQPVTPCLHEKRAPSSEQLLGAARHAMRLGLQPRVLPQVHKLLGYD